MNYSLKRHFLTLHTLLTECDSLWRPNPFIGTPLTWQEQFPQLSAACLALNEEELTSLENHPNQLLDWLQRYLPQLKPLHHLTDIALSQTHTQPLPSHWDLTMRGRKAEQIRAFIHSVEPHGSPLVDWCSGKGHLGRTLAGLHKVPCIALERDITLCQQGITLARKVNAELLFVNTDVLQCGCKLPQQSHGLALHACGELHRTLIKMACVQGWQALSVAPCCYAVGVTEQFRPLARLAQQHDLRLQRDDLRLAVQEWVTVSARNRQHQHRLAGWRLGFDALQRVVRGCDDYLNTPPAPLSAVNWGFEHYCRTMAQHKNLQLNPISDWLYYAELGLARWAQVRRLQLLRHGFRRALEVWLVLDLALYLCEAGYKVEISQFCERQLTPRNLLIHALRS